MDLHPQWVAGDWMTGAPGSMLAAGKITMLQLTVDGRTYKDTVECGLGYVGTQEHNPPQCGACQTREQY